jgi:putative acetyltransferase
MRDYARGDSEALADIFRRAVREIGPRDYSAEQIEAWAGGLRTDRLDARLSDGRLCLVAIDDANTPLAFGDLEADGHIDFLYAAPQAAGKGIAAALYDALETRARARGMIRLYTEASEAARRFFLKKGFAVVGRRDFFIGDVSIHNYAMEKKL